MPSFIELHDSIVRSIEHDGGQVRLNIDAYLHRWTVASGRWRGAGLVQPTSVTLGRAAYAGPSAPVGPITDGILSIGDLRLDNAIPDCIQTSGEVTLECAMADGAFTVRGETLEILPTSSPRSVEVLPDSLRPPDLGASSGMPVWALPPEPTSGLPLLERPSGGYWQFATSTVNFPNPMSCSDVVVLFDTSLQFAPDRRIATDALRRTYPRSTVVIVDEHRSGLVRVTCDDLADNFVVATATAIAAASGAWDEANPIVVTVGDEDVPITTRVVDNLWRASLWNRAG